MAFKKINDLIQIYPKKKIRRETESENCLVCSCAINKKLSTPYDFTSALCAMSYGKEGLRIHLNLVFCRLPKITRDRRRAGRNEIILECDPRTRGEKANLFGKKET